MNFLTNLFKNKSDKSVFKLITMDSDNVFTYNGKVYDADLVRSCIRPYAKGLGKTVAKHIREITDQEGKRDIVVNPDIHIKFMLNEPNQYMSYQKLIEKMAISLKLNNNAFAVIIRDDNMIAREIYPMPANGAEAIWLNDNELAIRFCLPNGQMPVFKYTDVIHLRGDFYQRDIFGDPIAPVLIPLMDCVGTLDNGLKGAIRNSSIIRWLLKINGGVRQEDVKAYAENFAKDYMNIEDSTGIGVAATDAKADLVQVDPKDYVPNASINDRIKQRVYSIFNTNEKIVQSCTDGDEWNAYFEAELEPDIRQIADEFTRKLFTRRERAFGNSIVLEADNLSNASFDNKLALQGLVDRGAMTPNEWREKFNMAPVPNGDEIIRRLDTAVVNQIKNLANKIQGKDSESDKKIIDTINKLIEGR